MWPFKKKNKKFEKSSRYVKICPRCNSINVKISHQGGLSGLTALGLPTMYKCRDCGLISYSFPEIDLNELKKKQKIKKG